MSRNLNFFLITTSLGLQFSFAMATALERPSVAIAPVVSAGGSPASMSSPSLGDVPTWDLSDLYKGIDDPKIAEDLETLNTISSSFSETYKGKIVSPDVSGEFIQRH